MIANNLTPFEPTHPGELIRDELEERHLTQAKLARTDRRVAIVAKRGCKRQTRCQHRTGTFARSRLRHIGKYVFENSGRL